MSKRSTTAEVLILRPINQRYSYSVPRGMIVQPGDIVSVPLRGQLVTGVVWELGAKKSNSKFKLKPIERKVELPALPKISRDFVQWVAAYTLAPMGSVLKMVLSVPKALEPVKPELGYVLSKTTWPEKLTEPRKKVRDVLQMQSKPLSIQHIAKQAGVTNSVMRRLKELGLLEERVITPEPASWSFAPVSLSLDQSQAAKHIVEAMDAGGHAPFLLDGVTGSGKTEVYFEAIAHALQQGKQALVLLPEIALSTQWLDRFAKRFGIQPLVWHSDVSIAKKRRTWRGLLEGEPQVVVGARSALFLPFTNLGVIVVDEEHDAGYKQEEGVIYHARDMAVVRAHLGGIPIVLASATPALETIHNCDLHRYRRLHLTQRHGTANLPDVELIEMRESDHEGTPAAFRTWLSSKLCAALADTVGAGEQAMLFLNRRGYAPLTLCKACGHRLSCSQCTAWLVEHKSRLGALMCHQCGFAQSYPDICDACGQGKSFIPCGPGVERILEEVNRLFPLYRIAVMASDTMTSPQAMQDLVQQVLAGSIDVLVGTQMMAKGHHFPKLTLVGVVDSDLGFAGGDLRAAEKTFQLMHQVSGRAGRADRPGRVLLQTYMPDHPVMQALEQNNREAFLEYELEDRERTGFPPFGRLAALIVSGPDETLVEQTARQLAYVAPRDSTVEVLGPAPAALAMVRGRYRWRLLLKSDKETKLQPILRHWLHQVQPASYNVKIQVDVDPFSFL
ncbi:MAG: primosomal protein N' [Pseudomonadota bacterium]